MKKYQDLEIKFPINSSVTCCKLKLPAGLKLDKIPPPFVQGYV